VLSARQAGIMMNISRTKVSIFLSYRVCFGDGNNQSGMYGPFAKNNKLSLEKKIKKTSTRKI
jgi:hypothetical protein